ncbi:hypothetical protein BLA29_004451, partial [Euroglyphus maynei]
FCQFCRQAPKSVRTQQNSYQLNHWLKNGQPPQFTTNGIRNESVQKFGNPMMDYINGQQQQHQQQKLLESSKKSEIIDNGFFGSEMDIVLHHHHHHRPMDSDPEDNDDPDDLQQLRATNQLSSALYDCMVNLHSLNYKIKQQQREKFNNDEIAEIENQQRQLLSNMEIIQQKLEKIEKDIEQKDSYAIHTSSSTLSATSPENFGISSDVMPSLIPTTPIKSTNLFGTTNSSNLAGVCGESNDSSIQNQPTLSALNSSDTTINNAGNDDIHELLNNSGTTSTTGAGDHLSQSQQKQLSNDQSSSTTQQQQQPPLARLLLTTTTNNTGNSSCSSLSHQPNTNHHHHHRHPSMTHDFLPVNLTDSEMKLEISNHYRDLQIARELVLLCSQ